MSSQMKQIKAIKRAIKTKNIPELKQLGIKHGFLSDKLRKKVWSLLLGLQTAQKQTEHTAQLRHHADPVEYLQIDQDVKRTPMTYYTNKDTLKSRAALSKILHGVFDHNDSLHYLQGFNDVTSVLYAVCNNIKLSQKISTKVAETLMSEFIMDNNDNDPLNVSQYHLIFDIIEEHDKTLHKLLHNSCDFIAVSISWLITWFAHQIQDINTISRIYDYCLCSDKLISSYLSAALMIYLKNDLLKAIHNEMTLFEYFNILQWDDLDFNRIICISQLLYNQYAERLNKKFNEYNTAMHEWYLSENSSETPVSTPMPTPPRTPYASSFDLLNGIPESMKEDLNGDHHAEYIRFEDV